MSKNHPNLSHLPLDALRGFEAAARLMSFTDAASELSLTQSAVSRQIKAVEESVGMPLFARYNRRLELTEAGVRLQRSVVSALDELEATMASLKGADDQVVTVTTSLSLSSLWLVPRLSGFRALHPGVDVRIVADDRIVSLERERMDCALRFCEPDAAPAGSIALISDEAFPVVSPKLLRDKSRPLKTPRDLRHHVLLKFEDAHGRVPHLEWPTWLAAWKLQGLEPAGSVTFSHYEQAIAAAVEAEGVAIGRSLHVARLLRQKKLVLPFEGRIAASRQFIIVTSRSARNKPAVTAFVEWVRQEATNQSA